MRIRVTGFLVSTVCAIFCFGCAGPSPAPIIDMQGVDPVAYNRDLAECVKRNASKAIELGNGVTRCIQAKGYKVLVGY